MPTCKKCGEEVDELVTVKVDGKMVDAPVVATAIRSPGARSAGRWMSRTTMSPLSQCLPTTRESIGSALDVRDTSAQV